MRKKLVITGLICGLLLTAGVCYSCSYKGKKNPETQVASLEAKAGDLQEMQDSGKQNDGTRMSEQKADKSGSNQDITSGERDNTASEEITQSPENAKTGREDSETMIYAHICGAVAKPGVYKSINGARVIDFITMAGGFRKGAAGDYINQAQVVTDGQRIYIPTEDEVSKLDTGELIQGSQNASDEPNTDVQKKAEEQININTANEEQLMNLPGIGQAKASGIIEYRSANGKFKTVKDLMKVPGIKEGLFQKISSYIVAE